MPSAAVVVTSKILTTPRLQQLCGMFDLPLVNESTNAWQVSIPIESRDWSVGLIVGPSGSGKSTIARQLWPSQAAEADGFAWSPDKSILDDFPPGLPIRDITGILSSVGFSSPPHWMKPFHALSTGQRFRATMARLLTSRLSDPTAGPIVLDEFTSTVDRTVAQIGSAAVAREIRARKLQFIAATCHEDVMDWLNPDWVYRPATQCFAWRFLQRRPPLTLSIRRVYPSGAISPLRAKPAFFRSFPRQLLGKWFLRGP